MTFRLQALPPEIQLVVAQHLPAPDFLRLSTTCRTLKELLLLANDQEWSWRSREEFRCGAPCVGPSARHPTWLDTCCCQALTDQCERSGAVTKGWIEPDDIDVWRIKVDEKRRMLLASSRDEDEPHIACFDLDTKERLQTLSDIGLYSHIELGDDHLVASHLGNSLSVFALPNLTDGDIGARQLSRHGTITPNRRFHCLRAIGTTLMTAGANVDFWDLTTCQRITSFPHQLGSPNPVRLLEVQYIEFDDDHAYLLCDRSIDIYERKSGRLVFRIHSAEEHHGYDSWWITPDHSDWHSGIISQCINVLIDPSADTASLTFDETCNWRCHQEGDGPGEIALWTGGATAHFKALHYTSRDLVIQTKHEYVLVVQNFKKLLQPGALSKDHGSGLIQQYQFISTESSVLQPSWYNASHLACDNIGFSILLSDDRRIATRMGYLLRVIISPDDDPRRLFDSEAVQIISRQNPVDVSSLQKTHNGYYLSSYNLWDGEWPRTAGSGLSYGEPPDRMLRQQYRLVIRTLTWRPH